MGRKSRRKRRRCERKAAEQPQDSKLEEALNQSEAEFSRKRTNLGAWLSGFNAEDVCVSLCISDLWLPNISSRVKHIFAIGLVASMEPSLFTSDRRVDTYPAFREFIQQLYARLPSFPMLEDYVPETDWGEVRIESAGSLLRSFYGGPVERIPDFVMAFLMLYGASPAARRDIHAALRIQDHVISNIDPSIIGSTTDIPHGHLDVPAEPFWIACRKALLSASDLSETYHVDADLTTALGQFVAPSGRSAFGDGVMTGSALPIFLLDVGALRIPISLRNALAAVVQLWADKIKDPKRVAQAASTGIGRFLTERFNINDIVPGPLRLMAPSVRLPYTFAAAMTGQRQVYLVIAVSLEDVQHLPAIEKDVNQLVSRKDWGLWSEGTGRGLVLRRADGTLPSAGEVIPIAVVASTSTVNGVLKWPKTTVRVIPSLPDFVTIFDSIAGFPR